MLSPMILANAIYTVVDAFTSEGNRVMAYIIGDNTGSISPNPVSAAQAWMYFALIALALIAVMGICSSFVFYQRRNDK
jgi:hypothetical protein